VLEIYESVAQSTEKQKRLRSSNFWRLFNIKSRQKKEIGRLVQLLETQGLKIAVKSGAALGEEKDDDWIVITLKLLPQPPPLIPSTTLVLPPTEWFEMMQTRLFESEREVEAFFIAPLLEKLGYTYDDIVIGFPVVMFKGVQKTTTEADFVVFNGLSREVKDTLVVIEAKKSDKGISVDHISQVKSYAQELLPSYYIVTNGQQIKVYQFNGLLAPDDCILDFDRTELMATWPDFYGHVSKESALQRKNWLTSKLINSQS
jgi:hypothetical protein